MLEDTNSLDGAHIAIGTKTVSLIPLPVDAKYEIW